MFASVWVSSTETGALVAERHWKGQVGTRTTAKICQGDGKTVQDERPYYVVRIQRKRFKAVAAAMEEFPPAAAVELLDRIVEEMESRRDPVEMQLLLDEMVDGGLPATTNVADLQELFPEDDLVQRVSMVLLGGQKSAGYSRSLPWRRAGISHLKNEFLLDVVERVDATVNRDGRHENVNLVGSVVATSRLSGLPDMMLTFSNPEVLGACNLHPCVRLKPFQKDRVVSFVPPDGKFTLMSYTAEVTGALETCIPIYVRLQTAADPVLPGLKVNMVVGFKPSSLKNVDGVQALFQLPPNILHTDFNTNCGALHIDADAQTCSWNIGQMDHTRTPCLNGTVALGDEASLDRFSFAPLVQLSFSYVHSALSGLAIRSLKLMNEPQQPFKGVRFVVQSGGYEVCL